MRPHVFGVLCVLLLLAPVVATAAEHEVVVSDFEFSPSELIIQKGDMVRWVWEAGAHTLVDGDPDNLAEAGTRFDVPLNAQDQMFEYTFSDLGTVEYFSRTDPSLKGTITVVEGTPVDRATWGWLKQVFEDPTAPRNRR